MYIEVTTFLIKAIHPLSPLATDRESKLFKGCQRVLRELLVW